MPHIPTKIRCHMTNISSALEHAEYLADASEQFLQALNKLAELTDAVPCDPAAIEEVESSMCDHASAVQNAIYEYRKRRDRCLS